MGFEPKSGNPLHSSLSPYPKSIRELASSTPRLLRSRPLKTIYMPSRLPNNSRQPEHSAAQSYHCYQNYPRRPYATTEPRPVRYQHYQGGYGKSYNWYSGSYFAALKVHSHLGLLLFYILYIYILLVTSNS